MRLEIVYLACPLTHDDPAVRQARLDAANRTATQLTQLGVIVYSPISHTAGMCRLGLAIDWEFWARFQAAFLAVSRSMIVLKMPGWENSDGVADEIRIMREFGRPVEYLDPEVTATLELTSGRPRKSAENAKKD